MTPSQSQFIAAKKERQKTNILYAHIIRVYKDPLKTCDHCGSDLIKGTHYRLATNFKDKYCEKCVGFFLSRYSLTWEIHNPSETELKWKRFYNKEIEDKILSLYGVGQKDKINVS